MRATKIEGQNAFAPAFHVTDGQNMRDQITSDKFCAFHTCLVEVQTNAGYIHETHE